MKKFLASVVIFFALTQSAFALSARDAKDWLHTVIKNHPDLLIRIGTNKNNCSFRTDAKIKYGKTSMSFTKNKEFCLVPYSSVEFMEARANDAIWIRTK